MTLTLNLSFETSSSGVPTGWTLDNTDYQFTLDNSSAIDGTQSLRIASSAGNMTESGSAYLYLTARAGCRKDVSFVELHQYPGGKRFCQHLGDSFRSSRQLCGGKRRIHRRRDKELTALRCARESARERRHSGLRCSAHRNRTAWFDNLSIDVNGQPYFPNPAPQQVQ